MITSLRNSPLFKHSRSSVLTVIPPLDGGGGYRINLKRGEKKKEKKKKDPSKNRIINSEYNMDWWMGAL